MGNLKIALFSFVAAVSFAFADDFKILFINSGSLNVGGKDRNVGDIIDDRSNIVWKSDRQAVKVQNVKDKTIKVLSSLQQKKLGYKNIFEFVSRTKRLSTRGDGLMDMDGLEEYLNNTFYLLDFEVVESMLETSANSYFQVEFTVDGKHYSKKLKGDAKSFTLEASVFDVNGARNKEVPVKVVYHDENGDELITDRMFVVVLEK